MPKRSFVTIDPKLSVPETIQLQPYVPWAEMFARKYGVPMVLHAPRGGSLPVKNDSAMHLYFFSYQAKKPRSIDKHKAEKNMKYVYGFPLPKIQTGNFMGAVLQEEYSDISLSYHEKAGRQSHAIRSSEDQVIARVTRKHLWILFNMAGWRWSGDRVVFERILEEAAPDFLPEECLQKFPRRIGRIAKVLRRHINPDSYSREFSILAGGSAHKAAERFSIAREGALEKHEALGAALVENALAAQSAERALQKIRSQESGNEAAFAAEFEHMLEWSTVRGLRVEGDTLKVFTSMIRLRDPKIQTKTYPLGEFVIEIKPLEQERREGNSNIILNIAIYPQESVWKSRWLHPEVVKGKNNICFGQGFNQAVWKLFQERKLKDLVHTLLTFLMIDAREPSLRTDASSSEKDYVPSESRPFYKDNAEREEARAAYVQIARESLERISQDFLRGEIKRLQEEEMNIVPKFCEERESWRSNTKLESAAKNLAGNDRLHAEELRILYRERALYDIDLTFGAAWLQARFLARIPNGAVADLRIFAWPEKNRLEIVISSGGTTLHANTWEMCEAEIALKLMHLAVTGYLGTAITLIYKMVEGLDQNEVSRLASARLLDWRKETEDLHE